MSDNEALHGFRGRVEAIEEAYEFFLSYAAKGVDARHGKANDSQARFMAERMAAALDGIADAARAGGGSDAVEGWLSVLAEDAARSRAALALIASLPVITSKIVDNFNASIHVRAMLTDIFILDEALGQAS